MTQMPDRSFAAFLFDMDGTLISSVASAERAWTAWALRHGIDVAAFLPTIHGVRAVETIRLQQLPGVDAEEEAEALTLAEMDDMDGIEEIAGARAFVGALPPDRWAIVTSAPRKLALRRLAAAGMPVPAVLVTADDVTHGKPAPDCFLLAAMRLGVAPAECLVFEDAAAGIVAAEAAGASVVVVTAVHHAAFTGSQPTIAGYEALAATSEGGMLRLGLRA